MIDSFKRSYPIYLAIDVILTILSFVSAYFIRYAFIGEGIRLFNFPNTKGYLFIFSIWLFFILIAFSLKNLHTTDRGLSIPKELGSVLTSIIYSSILVGAIIFFTKYEFFSRQVYVSSIIFLFIFLGSFRFIKRIVLRILIKKGFHNINVLIVGASKLGELVIEEVKKTPWWGFKIVGFLDQELTESLGGIKIVGKLTDLIKTAKKLFVDEVIITLPVQEEIVLQLIKEAKKVSIGVKVIPSSFNDVCPVVSTSYLGSIPLLTYKERIHHPTEFILKRVLDFCGAVVSLLLLFPLFLIISLFIKIDSNGPIFFIRSRMGTKGKIFNFYKFRSMVNNAEYLREDLIDENDVKGGIIFKIKKDPRITRVGKFLRRFSLDELPQLINVLKGDMSLVGPRPPLPDEVSQYTHDHIERLSIRPGITGLLQVRGRSELSFRNWVRWDLWYINNWSLGLDFKIILWTIPVIIKGKGAY